MCIRDSYTGVHVKVNVNLYSASSWTHSKALRYSTRSQWISVLPAHPAFIRQRNEPYLPLPSQPKLLLIYRPLRVGRLSWPWVAGWLHTEINVRRRELNPDTVCRIHACDTGICDIGTHVKTSYYGVFLTSIVSLLTYCLSVSLHEDQPNAWITTHFLTDSAQIPWRVGIGNPRPVVVFAWLYNSKRAIREFWHDPTFIC